VHKPTLPHAEAEINLLFGTLKNRDKDQTTDHMIINALIPYHKPTILKDYFVKVKTFK